MFKFFWTTHKWTGIVLSIAFTCTAVTGFMLLFKKKVDWLQPPTQTDIAGDTADFITMQQMFDIVWEQEHADFTSLADIDRVDFRPNDRVFKVRSKHHNAELQVGAISGGVLSVSQRTSDLVENIHDGSFFAGWVHSWIMPLAAIGLLFMIFSGLWLWIEPTIRKRRRKRRLISHPVTD